MFYKSFVKMVTTTSLRRELTQLMQDIARLRGRAPATVLASMMRAARRIAYSIRLLSSGRSLNVSRGPYRR